MQNFLLMPENQYKASARSTISAMSLIKLRLDISNLLSTHMRITLSEMSCNPPGEPLSIHIFGNSNDLFLMPPGYLHLP